VRRFADRTRRIDNYYDLYEVPVRLLHHFDLGLHGDPYQPGGLPEETVFDAFGKRGIPYRLWYYHTAESRNMSELVDEIAGDARVLFLYTAELDAMMHRLGIFHQEVEDKLERYERFLERVVDRASRHNRRARVYLLSDHGMTDVRSEVDVWGGLARSGYTLGRDYLGFFDSTMVRLWSNEEVARAAATIMEGQGSGRLLNDEELENYGCLFPDRRYGEHILLADPGVMVVPSFMGCSRLAAMHGYAPEDIYSLGCFYTNDESGDMPESILGFKDYLLERIAEAD
jgi:hypothetical protein